MELRRQQALELPAPPRRVAAAAVALAALALGPGAAAAAAQDSPVYDSRGNLVGTPFVPAPEEPLLTEDEALARARAHGKVEDWLARYPERTLTTEAELVSKDQSGPMLPRTRMSDCE